MNKPHRLLSLTLLCWLALLCAGVVWLGSQAKTRLSDTFASDTSIAHRMLSQAAVQHEAVLKTLGALRPASSLPHLLSQLQIALPQLEAMGRQTDAGWLGDIPAPAGIEAAFAQAKQLNYLISLPATPGHYWLVAPSGWAMLLDAMKLVPQKDFAAGLGKLTLDLPSGTFALLQRQADSNAPGWKLHIEKPLGAVSQRFLFQSDRTLTPDTWPWTQWLAWAAFCTLLAAALYFWLQFRANTIREKERARLNALAQLNTLGEMAAGLAHELNQPLTAILANTGAAERMLDDDNERETVRHALQTTAGQARRAADIIARLRAMVNRPVPQARQAIDPDEVARALLFLREADLGRQGTRLTWHNGSPSRRLIGDRVALEQILHNLVQNAADALAGKHTVRRIDLQGATDGLHYVITVSDTGPGIPQDALPHLFEPFFTTREHGMGLGLALCETLAGAMDGKLTAGSTPSGGARFTLTLPLEETAR